MIGHIRGMLSTYRSDAITLIVLQPDMVYANLWALCYSYSFRSVTSFWPSEAQHFDMELRPSKECLVIMVKLGNLCRDVS